MVDTNRALWQVTKLEMKGMLIVLNLIGIMVSVCVCVWAHVSVCVCVCLCVFVHAHASVCE